MVARRSLAEYLALDYPFQAIADPEGGYVIVFPDLPGCMTQVDTIDAIGPAAAEIKELWIETEYERGNDIPLPSYPERYSGRFNLRLPKSLHHRLVEDAERNDISLNQHVVTLLAAGAAGSDPALQTLIEGQERLRDELARYSQRLEEMESRLTTSGVEPQSSHWMIRERASSRD